MKDHHELSGSDFESLLALFSPDREAAGEQYVKMRSGLVRFFQFKGCSDPQHLADETINRVAAKISSFDTSRNDRPVSYFYGFASNVLLEYRRIAKREFSLSEIEYGIGTAVEETGQKEVESDCLQKCLQTLPESEREMIVEYYACEGNDRARLRKNMCERLKSSTAALHTRIFRLKADLRSCMENCLGITGKN